MEPIPWGLGLDVTPSAWRGLSFMQQKSHVFFRGTKEERPRHLFKSSRRLRYFLLFGFYLLPKVGDAIG